jgi:hypothetical protein
VLLHGEDGGVEALEVAGLEDAVTTVRAGDEIVGLGEGGGERLFDEQIEAGVEELRGHGVVKDRGHGDRGGVEMKVGGEQGLGSGEDRNSVLGGVVLGAGGIGIDGGNQGDRLTGLFQLAIDAEVILAEGAAARDGNAQLLSGSYFPSPSWSPSTALRQRP